MECVAVQLGSLQNVASRSSPELVASVRESCVYGDAVSFRRASAVCWKVACSRVAVLLWFALHLMCLAWQARASVCASVVFVGAVVQLGWFRRA